MRECASQLDQYQRDLIDREHDCQVLRELIVRYSVRLYGLRQFETEVNANAVFLEKARVSDREISLDTPSRG